MRREAASWVHLWLFERLGCADLPAGPQRHQEIAQRIAGNRGVPWNSMKMQAFGAGVVQAVLQADRSGQDGEQAATAIVDALAPDTVLAVARCFAPDRGEDDARPWAVAAAKVFALPLIDELDDVRASLRNRIDDRWIEPWLDGRWLDKLRQRRLWSRPVAEPKALPTVQDLAILFAICTHLRTARDPRALEPRDALAADWFWAEGAELLRLLELTPLQLGGGQIRAASGWARLLHAGNNTRGAEWSDRDVLEFIELVLDLRIEPEGCTLARDEPANTRLAHLIDPSRRPWRPPDPVSIHAQPNPFHN